MRKKIVTILLSVVALSGLTLILVVPTYAQQKPFSISGQIFEDTNRNGFKDSSEKMVPNAQISINGKNNTKILRTADASGKYSFQLSDPGTYTVTLQNSSNPTYPGQSRSIVVTKQTPKSIANFAALTAIASTQSEFQIQSIDDCNAYCPDVYPGSICEQISEDTGYCKCTNNNTNAETNNPPGCTSGGNTGGGCSAWGGVDNCSGWCQQNGGGYCLPSDNCATCHQTTQTCNPDRIDANGYSCNSYCNSLGQQCNPTSCACEPRQVTYSVSGYIYLDKDGNGQVTSGDAAFTQSPVTLTLQPGGGGSSISVSSSGGYYSQNVSTAGSYSIGLSAVPAGYRVTTTNPQSFLLNNSTPTRTIDFGLAPNDYKVSGVVFIDTNKNQVKDANEIGVGNETVSVSSGNGELNAQTNTSGQYTRTLPSQGLYSIRLLTKPQYENTSPEIQNFSITNTNNAPVFNFGIIPKATPSPSPTPATPVVKFLKPATDNLTVSGMMEVQATASVSGSTFTSFKICTDVANDCIVADSATVTGRSVITVNVPGGADTTELTNGNHTLTATAVAANGKTGTATRTIKVQNNTPTPTKTNTPTPSKTPTPTTPGNTGTPNTSTPIPNSLTPRPTCGGENTGGSVIICITPPQSITPTPGACNNNNFCDFGENVNTCPAECQIRCGDNICSTPQENPFSCEADCGDPGTSATPTPTGTGATSTATPTRNPSHTATPTNPIGSTNTPTRNPSHTATPTVIGQTGTPTLSPSPQDIILNVSVKLPGIGNKSGDVTNPVNKTIVAAVAVYNSSNQYVKQATGNLTFDGQVFKGPINIGSLPAGSYTTYIKTSNSLIKRLTPTITGGTGGPINMPQVELITGDFDQTNKLDIVDYNKLLTCYGKNQQGNILNIFGTNAFTCGLQDLNDDGKVDEKDVNIFLRGFAIREGDKP